MTGLDPQAAATLLNDASRLGDLGPCDLYTAPDGRQYLLRVRWSTSGELGGYRGVRTELRAQRCLTRSARSLAGQCVHPAPQP